MSSVIRVKIQNRFTDVLLDTGAAFSVVSERFAKQRNFRIDPIGPNDVSCLMAANNQKIFTIGKTALNLIIGTECVKHVFLVVGKLSSALICGLDFIQGKIDLQFSRRQVVVNGRTTVPLLPKDTYLGVARLKKKISLAPGSERVLVITLPRKAVAGNVSLSSSSTPFKMLQIKPHDNGLPKIIVKNCAKRWKTLGRFCPVANCIKIQTLEENGVAQQVCPEPNVDAQFEQPQQFFPNPGGEGKMEGGFGRATEVNVDCTDAIDVNCGDNFPEAKKAELLMEFFTHCGGPQKTLPDIFRSIEFLKLLVRR